VKRAARYAFAVTWLFACLSLVACEPTIHHYEYVVSLDTPAALRI